MTILQILLFTLCAGVAHARSPLTGVVEVKVDDGPNFFQVFINSTKHHYEYDKRAPSSLVNKAFKEFVNPLADMKRLEELKGSKKNGSVYANFGMFQLHDNSEELTMSCGSVDSEGKGAYYLSLEERGVVVNIMNNPTGHMGPIDSLEVASERTLTRTIAGCLARLPGMPKLKPAPKAEKVQIDSDRASMDMVFEWLSDHPRMGKLKRGSAAVTTTIHCLLNHVARSVPNATGEHLILRTTYSKRSKSNITYFAFVDKHEYPQLKDADTNDLMGPWPSGYAWDFDMVLEETLGKDTNVLARACALESGLKIPTVELSFPVAGDCIQSWPPSPSELLNLSQAYCQEGRLEGCLLWGAEAVKLDRKCDAACMAEYGGRDFRQESRDAYMRACEMNDADGCYSLGKILLDNMNTDTIAGSWAFERACALKPTPSCVLYRVGLDNKVLADSDARVDYNRLCNQAGTKQFKLGEWWDAPCVQIGAYWVASGYYDRAIEPLEKACIRRVGRDLGQRESCSLYAEALLQVGRVADAEKIYENHCNVFNTMTCQKYAQYLEAKGDLEKAYKYFSKSCSTMGFPREKLTPQMSAITTKRGCLEKALLERKLGREKSYQEALAVLCKDRWEPRREEACKLLKVDGQ